MSRIQTVQAFNDAITRRDLDALARLMTPDHTFIDSAGTRIAGREAARAAWQGFFAAFPSYRNDFDRLIEDGAQVIITGRSVCDDARLHGPAIWRATVPKGALSLWEVFDDTPETRALLGL